MMRNGRCSRQRNRSKATHTVSHASRQEYVQLRKWIKSLDSTCSIDLEPCEFKETGRGLRANKPIHKGEIIVSIPESALITTNTVFRSDIGAILKKCVPPLSPQRVLSIFLVWEWEKGTTSSWYPYIQTLPSTFSTPLYFTRQELERLPPSVYVRSISEQTRVQDIFASIRDFLQKHVSDFKAFTYERFRWAWCVVNTRSVYVKIQESPYLSLMERETNVALAPYLDLLNHSAEAKVEARVNEESGRYEIVTADEYQKYDQVFIHYNPYSNDELFIEYGFTLPHNPFNVYELTTADLVILRHKLSVDNWDRKMEIIGEMKLKNDLTCRTDGMAWNLHTLLRIFAMSCEELNNWRVIYTSEVSQENEVRALSFAKVLLQEALVKINKYLVSERDALSEHEKLALTLVQDKKHLLEQTLDGLLK
ncbi:SET domain-containing protein 4-like isoform X2 [Haliotis asinina]|uniref:SET domain-containing protein 4-like isoform X2 n=1 Tax=Haliotis asinina TaxID=109174 RepID=UPI0035318C32